MLTLHPPSFIETEDCFGPNFLRGQPSRETPGTLMSDIKDKYITEFELPYRNVDRYIKEIGNNWNRLDDKSKSQIRKSFKDMGINGMTENFGNLVPLSSSEQSSSSEEINNFIKYLGTDTTNNPKMFMDALWYSKSNNFTYREKLYEIRNSIHEWSIDNSYVLHCNWKSGSVLGFLFLVILILIIVSAVSSSSGSGSSNSFGKRF